ncbi:hypothetical protein R1sor_013346 [Riccia sorocarpa]|uniref:Uncharacterized protein n=1 Tax=Riccia sorocarpa TaxID=122646 RepID=A0ABD3H8X9_9MARC
MFRVNDGRVRFFFWNFGFWLTIRMSPTTSAMYWNRCTSVDEAAGGVFESTEIDSQRRVVDEIAYEQPRFRIGRRHGDVGSRRMKEKMTMTTLIKRALGVLSLRSGRYYRAIGEASVQTRRPNIWKPPVAMAEDGGDGMSAQEDYTVPDGVERA